MANQNVSKLKKRQILVLKVGGALLDSSVSISKLMQTISLLMSQGQSLVLVHGGGCLVEQQLSANGMVTEKRQGLRVTPEEQIPIITGVLAGTANKSLQSAAAKAGIKSVGLSLADADLFQGSITDPSLGLVGKVVANKPDLLSFVLSQSWLPIVSSIGMDEQGNLLNVNADQAAGAIAKLLTGKLFLLSDVAGVLDDKGQLIARLNSRQISQLIAQGVVCDGMQVKVQAALDVATWLDDAVYVASWRDVEQLQSLNGDQYIGTQIQG